MKKRINSMLLLGYVLLAVLMMMLVVYFIDDRLQSLTNARILFAFSFILVFSGLSFIGKSKKISYHKKIVK